MPKRKTPDKQLPGFLCFEFVRHKLGWRLTDFDREFRMRGSRLARKWRDREHSPSKLWIDRFEKVVPGVKSVYELPLWRLLADKPIKADLVRKLMSPFCREDAFLPYDFPDNADLSRKDRRPLPVLSRNDSHRLFERGDLFGFMPIAALVREAEALGDDEEHAFHIGNLYRSLPAIGRVPWIWRDFGQLCKAVQMLHRRVPFSVARVSVDWTIINGQRSDACFEPCREFRPIDPLTRRFQEIADPIIVHYPYDIGAILTDESADDPAEAARYPMTEEFATKPSRASLQERSKAYCQFRQFLELARIWQLPRYTWEPILGIDSQALNSWLYETPDYLPGQVRMRIRSMTDLRSAFLGVEMNDVEQRELIETPLSRLAGKSIRQSFMEGRYLTVFETLTTSANSIPSDEGEVLEKE